MCVAGAQIAAAATNDPFAAPQRAGHARSNSAPGPRVPPAAQPQAGAADATAQLLAGGAASSAQQQHQQQRDLFAPDHSLRATSSDGGTASVAANGAAGAQQQGRPAAVDPFAPKPQAGLGVTSAAARLAATPPAKVLVAR